MRKLAIVISLLLLTPACQPRGVERWLESQAIQHRLERSEADLYIPSSFEAARKLLVSFDQPHFDVFLRFGLDEKFRESEFRWRSDSITRVLLETRKRREELEEKRLRILFQVQSDLDENPFYDRHRELVPLLERVRESLRRTRSFRSYGVYDSNLQALDQLRELHRDLRSRWRRYHGNPSSDFQIRRQFVLYRERLQEVRPAGIFILVDTARNKLYLRNGNETLLEATCSTGSGRTLIAGEREWTFRTPKGEFAISRIIEDPVWRRPDWAFLEEGKSVPESEEDRLQRDALGEYALGFGDGYFIHGTLYTRLLGEHVTHGCIRLASPDLSRLVARIDMGTPVYIF